MTDPAIPEAPARSRGTRNRILRWTVTVAVLVVIGFAFSDSLTDAWDQVRDEQLSFDWRMVVAALLFAVAVPLSGVLWGRVLTELTGRRVSALDAASVHCSSWLLKYVPGQVGSVVNKVLWGQKRGMSRTAILVSFVYENVFLQVASLVPATAILLAATGFGVFSSNPDSALLPLLLLVPLCLVAFGPGLRIVLSFATRRILKREASADQLLPTSRALAYAAAFIVPRVLNGVGFVLVAVSVTDVAADDWLPLGAAYVFGGAIGILAIFVPSGLGVRESVTVLFAKEFMPTSQAIIAALVARLLSVVGDLGVLGVYGATKLALHREDRPQ